MSVNPLGILHNQRSTEIIARLEHLSKSWRTLRLLRTDICFRPSICHHSIQQRGEYSVLFLDVMICAFGIIYLEIRWRFLDGRHRLGGAIPSVPSTHLSYNRCNSGEVLVVVAPVDKPLLPCDTNPVELIDHRHPI